MDVLWFAWSLSIVRGTSGHKFRLFFNHTQPFQNNLHLQFIEQQITKFPNQKL
jgi:hypothetical protein